MKVLFRIEHISGFGLYSISEKSEMENFFWWEDCRLKELNERFEEKIPSISRDNGIRMFYLFNYNVDRYRFCFKSFHQFNKLINESELDILVNEYKFRVYLYKSKPILETVNQVLVDIESEYQKIDITNHILKNDTSR